MQSRRNFLFLQGPHGPFFFELSRALQKAGHGVVKIGFNRGDQHYWKDKTTYTPYTDPVDGWSQYLTRHCKAEAVSDLVIYGDTRQIHADAKQVARALGLRIHCFEEGYLRPYWITYERGGANGHSRLMEIESAKIRAAVTTPETAQPEAPAIWGAMWHHTFLGSIYHANILFRNGGYPNYHSHRSETVLQEWLLHCKRLAIYPFNILHRHRRTRALYASSLPFHVGLLQLGHDASVRDHSDVGSMRAFVSKVMAGFAIGAPKHHKLVFKAHPLEDGREDIERHIKAEAAQHECIDRVHYIPGGKLGPLLDRAVSALTVNSTAGQQVLWRGLPLKTFGRSVYGKPEFVSDQSLTAFFRAPDMPNLEAYRDFRQFLLETSQVRGGYYTARARANATRLVVDLMLKDCDPYDTLLGSNSTGAANLSLVTG